MVRLEDKLGIMRIGIRKEIRKKALLYIKFNDVFWSYQLREGLGIESESKDASVLSDVMKDLLKENIIQPCDRKKGFTQYILV